MSPNPFPLLEMVRRQDSTPSNSTVSATPSATSTSSSTSTSTSTPSTTLSSTPSATLSATPSATTSAASSSSGGLAGWGIFLLVMLGVALLVLVGGCVFQQVRAKRFGATTPMDGAKGWFSRATYKLRNPRARSASAGFEGISAGPRSAAHPRGMEADEAWDTRVGTEYHGGYMDDTELQTQGHQEFGNGSSEYTGAPARGRFPPENPFIDEHAAPSLRSISPRPHEGGSHLEPQRPGSSRRSLFKEEM